MGSSSSKPAPHDFLKEELSYACTYCGKPALEFETFVAVGPVHEFVAQKASEITAFLSSTNEPVRCQQCALKQMEEMENQVRQLEKQNQRTQEMVRKASIRSQRTPIPPENGTLRRRRSFIGRIMGTDASVGDEDYISEPEMEAVTPQPVSRPSNRLRRRSSVRFADQQQPTQQVQPQVQSGPENQAQQVTWQPPVYTQPQDQHLYQQPQNSASTSQIAPAQQIQVPPPQPTISPPAAVAASAPQASTSSLPQQVQYGAQSQAASSAPPLPPYSPPPPPQSQGPPPPPQSQPPPPPSQPTPPPPVQPAQSTPQPPTGNLWGPPPGPPPPLPGERDMTQNSPISSTPGLPLSHTQTYNPPSLPIVSQGQTQDPSYQGAPPAQGTLSREPSFRAPAIPMVGPVGGQSQGTGAYTTPPAQDAYLQRMASLRSQISENQAAIARIEAEEAERARQWAEEDAQRKELEATDREARRLQRLKEQKEQESTKKIQQRQSRPPPRDSNPSIFGGNKQPKKSDETTAGSGGGLIKSLIKAWEDSYPKPTSTSDQSRGIGGPPPNQGDGSGPPPPKQGGGSGGLFTGAKTLLKAWEEASHAPNQGGGGAGNGGAPPGQSSRGVGGGMPGIPGLAAGKKVSLSALKKMLQDWEASSKA